jgi:hypothetical protein
VSLKIRQIAGGGTLILLAILMQVATANAQSSASHNRVFEWTVESKKAYADPFNDVDVDVIFSRSGESWRVPTFWRGGSKWTVRFAAPTPGEYSYRLESTDHSNPDLNGHEAKVTITAYKGSNPLLQHGMLRVSANKRYFEHADGTPFYWLGDTWWSGMSTRLSWEDFQKLTADRKSKGFTVIQIVAGLVPFEEQAPSDPGFCNEGGCVWDPEFKQINPKFFDYADRRVEHLVDSGMVPAIVGGWNISIEQMGVAKLKKHWRYIIARYSAYPTFWVIGGEVFDPPEAVAKKLGPMFRGQSPGGWTEVGRYIRATDPLHHPTTVHEVSPDDLPLQDESVTDFALFQPAHFSWPSIAVEVAEVSAHYSRTALTKPLVVGEIGYERLGETHLEDFQRVAFWLGMLNGAAGHTYGANGTWESYSADKPFHRWKWSILTWEDGMNLPGSYQVGLGAKLLEQYPWWRFEPHQEWVTPRGSTLKAEHDGINRLHLDLVGEWGDWANQGLQLADSDWKKQNGNFRQPYAAGVPGEVRFIYMPYFGLMAGTPPTVLGLEQGVRYHAFLWDPSLGAKFDLGAVERPAPGTAIREDKFSENSSSKWTDHGAKTARSNGKLTASGDVLTIADDVNEKDVVAAVDAEAGADAGLVLRFHDNDNYVAAVYSSKEKSLYLIDRAKGADEHPLGSVAVPDLGSHLRLTAEVRGNWAAASITDGQHTYTSAIVRVKNATAGAAGLFARGGGAPSFGSFELRSSPTLVKDEHLERKLYDARGGYRGELKAPGTPQMGQMRISSWDDFGKEKVILLDAYRPERLPFGRDWVLVLEHTK